MNPLIVAALPTLTSLYSAPKRYYHNLDHINFCLGRLEWAKYKPEFNSLCPEHWEALEIAIWFHDAIYNPYAQQVRSGYSEEESARLLQQFVNQYSGSVPVNHIACQWANDLIMKTSQHGRSFQSLSPMARLILDIDLAGFGLPWEHFLYNTENVCMEYEMCESQTERLRIAEGNAGFQTALLKRDRIYYTDTFHKEYETQARQNIAQRADQVAQMVNHDQS